MREITIFASGDGSRTVIENGRPLSCPHPSQATFDHMNANYRSWGDHAVIARDWSCGCYTIPDAWCPCDEHRAMEYPAGGAS